MRKAKRLHRPSLKDWECDGIYEKFPAFVESISSPQDQYRSFILSRDDNCHQRDGGGNRPGDASGGTTFTSSISPPPRNLPMILDGKTVTREDFAANFEATETPCVIRNVPAGYDGAPDGASAAIEPWPALERWRFGALKKSGDLGERVFKCGEDDDGDSIKVKLRHFLRYLEKNRDDSPLYIFDSAFDEDRHAKSILSDYRVPAYFREDLFGLVSESRRPPYRWFLVGPQRSGTCVHVDPLATNAWNTLIDGRKRWVLFPPNVPKGVVKGRGLIGRDEDDEAVHYFMYILPRIKRKAAALRDTDEYRNFACYEFTQNPGETVFVPNGWWHAVLNLTDTVGVTQNFCSPRNFEKVWIKTRVGRKRMAWKWLCQLDERYPELAERARMLNKRDNFRMKYDPEEIRRREREEKRRKLQKLV